MVAHIKRFYDWLGARVYSPYANYILSALFFFEANLLLLPVDPLLILYCLHKKERSFIYATIATCASVLGGMAGYAIGATLWNYAGESIIHSSPVRLIMTPANFAYLSNLYQEHEWWAVFIAGFTPIPYKAATLTAGFCNLSFVPFVLCSFLARGARFYLYAFIIYFFGDQIRESIDRYFNIIVGLTTIVIIAVFWLLKA